VVRVSIEVRNGAARFVVAVRAESIQQAVSSVTGRYLGGDYRVKFPIDSKGFFVNDTAARVGLVGFERPL
jgi:hypothetical protein